MVDRIPTSLEEAKDHVPRSVAEATTSIPTLLDEIKRLLSSVEEALHALPSLRDEVLTRRGTSRKKKALRIGLVGVLALGGLFVATKIYDRMAGREKSLEDQQM